MHCPNCGTKTSSEQKFCRSCGLGLEKLSQVLSEQLAAEALERPQPEGVARLHDRQRRVEHWLGVASATFVTLVILSALVGIVYGVMINKGQILGGLFLLFMVLGAASSLGLVFYNETLKEKLAQRPAPEPAPPAKAKTAELLTEARFEPVPSVTERTTELLEEQYRER